MDKINFQDGVKVSNAKVTIDGVDYPVTSARYDGATPLSAYVMNKLQDNIDNAKVEKEQGKELIETTKITKLDNIETEVTNARQSTIKDKTFASIDARIEELEEDVDKIETATVQLIAVTDAAPEHCSEGDKYYNTSTNLIYTATGTDTWGVTGEAPSQLYLYMDISEQKLYYYDGNTFSSYGGGSGGTGGETLPIGSIMLYSGNVLPVNWLLCNGQAISRTKYSALFEKIGTTYGSGDGSTTFNVPNLKGKVAVGKDENDTDFDTLGETGGEKTHTLTENEMPTHTHSIGKPVSTNSGSKSWLLLDVNKGEYSEQRTQPSGGGQPHNNLQPYIVQNFIIKAEQAPGTATLAEVLPVGSQINFDGEVSDIPTGWEQVDDPNEYSTTETIVGTWINSKPIYRKVISQNITNYTGDININLNTANIELFTDARVLVDTDSFTSVTHSQPSTNFYIRNFVFRKSANNNTVTVSTNIEGLSGTIYVIIEYTKTTD